METAELVLRSGGGLLAVLGTLWICVRVVKARTGVTAATQGARLRVLARASVGRHASVVTIDAGDRVLVVGVGEQGVRLLAEQPALPPVEPAAVERVDVAALPGQRDGSGTTRSATAGSLVDPGTWRAVVAVARERTVRR